MIEFKLAIPPSNNKYYRHVKNRVLLSAEGRAYKKYVKAHLYFLGGKKIEGSVRIEIEIHARDDRKRDLDNFPKGIFDALTHAQVWNDDKQVDEMVVLRRENKKDDPHIAVRIYEL